MGFYTPSPTSGGFSLPTVRGNPIGFMKGVSSTVPFADTVTESRTDTAGSEALYIHNAYVDPTNGSLTNIEGSVLPFSSVPIIPAHLGSVSPAPNSQRSSSEPPRLLENTQPDTFKRLLDKFRARSPSQLSTEPFADTVTSNRL